LGTAAGAALTTALSLIKYPFLGPIAPVGWVLGGITAGVGLGFGVAAYAVAWAVKRTDDKVKLLEYAKTKIQEVFDGIKNDSIKNLNDMGDYHLANVRYLLDNQIKEYGDALETAKNNRPSQSDLDTLKRQCETLSALINESEKLFDESSTKNVTGENNYE
jgi:hypothetical protein